MAPNLQVTSALTYWNDYPKRVAIATFAMPATEVPSPAITVCNPSGFDIGEYVRAIYDNFQYRDGEGQVVSKLTAVIAKKKYSRYRIL